ncbi:MAG TPA: tetratricopeptide repeat protein [Allosphingosinicella sp.]|uniref:tetratricopeptide repeat protein n=1 Tax=Allosphingosinicella sp. TaxID=2823234 RepID=UPI002ED975D8
MATCSATAQPSVLEQARTARFAGNIDEAERLLTAFLRSDPNHYLGLYNMGLVYEARAVRAPLGKARLSYYRTAAQWLEKAYRSPGRRTAGADAYTIYNSLGTMYLGLGDLTNAARYLNEGLKNEGRLSNFSKGRLYANLGYLHALQGDIPQARRYFQAGAQLDSDFAKESLRRLDAAKVR